MVYYSGGRDPWTDPMTSLRRIQEELNRTVGGGLRGTASSEYPPLNVWRSEEGTVVTAEVPGVPLDDLEITVHQNTLTLKGQRGDEAKSPDVTYHRRERLHGAFARTVTLPYSVDAEQVRAAAKNGILTIELPRPETDKPKRIPIQTA